MKPLTLFFAPVLGLTLLLTPARAEDAPKSNVQEVQGIIEQLSRMAATLTGKQDGAPDFGKVLGELSKLAGIATPGATKEEQAQESQLIAFLKSLLALVPQVPDEAMDAFDPDAGPVQVDIQAGGAPKDYRIQSSGGLSTGSLTAGGLNGPSRTSEPDWRALFPVRPAPITPAIPAIPASK
jgi:hypothetical protein